MHGDARDEREREEVVLVVGLGTSREELGHRPAQPAREERRPNGGQALEPLKDTSGVVDPAAGARELLLGVGVAVREAERLRPVLRGEPRHRLAEREPAPPEPTRELVEHRVLGARPRHRPVAHPPHGSSQPISRRRSVKTHLRYKSKECHFLISSRHRTLQLWLASPSRVPRRQHVLFAQRGVRPPPFVGRVGLPSCHFLRPVDLAKACSLMRGSRRGTGLPAKCGSVRAPDGVPCSRLFPVVTPPPDRPIHACWNSYLSSSRASERRLWSSGQRMRRRRSCVTTRRP